MGMNASIILPAVKVLSRTRCLVNIASLHSEGLGLLCLSLCTKPHKDVGLIDYLDDEQDEGICGEGIYEDAGLHQLVCCEGVEQNPVPCENGVVRQISSHKVGRCPSKVVIAQRADESVEQQHEAE